MNRDYKLKKEDIRIINIIDFGYIHELNAEWMKYLTLETEIKMNIEFIDIINIVMNNVLKNPPIYDYKKKIERKIEFIINLLNSTNVKYMREITSKNVDYYINKNFRKSKYLYVLNTNLEMIEEEDIIKYMEEETEINYIHRYIVNILRKIGLKVFSITKNDDNSLLFDYINIRYPIFIYNS
jgi:hypothetical protein